MKRRAATFERRGRDAPGIASVRPHKNDTRSTRGDATGSRIVAPHDDRTARARNEIGEACFQRVDRSVVVKVISLHGEHTKREGTELCERAETLVDLDDEIALAPVPLCTNAQH